MNELVKLRARLGEIQNELSNVDAAALTNEQMDTINALSEESEQITKKINALEKLEEIKAKANISQRKTTPTPVANTQPLPKKEELSAGEFFQAVKNSVNGNLDKRLKNSAMMERNAEDGGFLVPADVRTDILKKVTGDESLLSKTMQLNTSSNHMTIPVNETAPWDGAGIQAYWEGEGQQMNDSKDGFGTFDIKLHKLTALVKVTDELLEDAPALESYIKAQAPLAMMHKVNSAIIGGTGVGKPAGFLSSGFKYKVSKESGQTADTIVFENIVKMTGRILPQSFAKAVWLVNPACMDQLRLMSFKAGATSPVPAYLPPSGLAEAPYGTLMGRPIMPMMGGVKALGEEGDIALVDLSYYISAVKGGIKSDMSTHVYFDTNHTAFKFIMRIGGGCPYKAPVTTENGDFEMSGIVTLEDR
jgi:HK97 family phage major capsid protein